MAVRDLKKKKHREFKNNRARRRAMTIGSWTATEMFIDTEKYEYYIANVPRDLYDHFVELREMVLDGRSAWPLLKGYEYVKIEKT